jgi:MFS family permease
MKDPNAEYPVLPPRKRTKNPFASDAGTVPASSPRRRPVQQRQKAIQPGLPPGGTRKTLSISLGAGILVAIVNIVFTLVNAPLYQQAARYAKDPTHMPLNVASSIFWIFVLEGIISLIVYLIAGFIIGRVAVARRLGFFGGFVASAISLIIGYIAGQIPNYPGSLNTGFSNPLKAGGGIIAALIFLIIAGLIGGLLGWLGARLATRRHPFYYVEQDE